MKLDLSQVKNVAEGADPKDLHHMLEVAKERERLLRDDPLNYGYSPHPGQLQVHRSDADTTFLVAANRWGKSVTGIRETIWRAIGKHPYKKVRPHDMIWSGFVDFGFYLKVTKRLFDEWVPKKHLIQFHDSEKWAKIRRADGGTCMIHFLSYESGRKTWQGAGVDFIWLDEELPQDIYQEALARVVDRRGQMLLTQTPVSGLNWAYEEIYLPARTGGTNTVVVQGALAERDDNAPYQVGKPLVPHLTRDQIVRLARATKDPDERAIRVFGEFRGRSGGVYKAYKPEVHVVPAFRIPTYYAIWGGVDPGYHGFAAVGFAQDPMGRTYIPFEYYSQQESHATRIRALWKRVREVFPLGSEDYVVFYCDTANPQDIMELNVWAQKYQTRMVFTSLDQGKKAREAGIQRVQEYLEPVRSRTTPEEVQRPTPERGEPMLYFFDSLRSVWAYDEESVSTSRLLWEITRYTWRKARRNEAHPSDADEKSADGAHALAALRYGVMARMGAPEMPDPEEEVPQDPKLKAHLDALEEREAQREAEERLAMKALEEAGL
jgi:phage terminase large subunit-like protein